MSINVINLLVVAFPRWLPLLLYGFLLCFPVGIFAFEQLCFLIGQPRFKWAFFWGPGRAWQISLLLTSATEWFTAASESCLPDTFTAQH